MLKVLRGKMMALGRGEEGVALVVTLGIFMFLYVACASVYAIGMAVKEKMHLQAACDSAAYSAAIVQADTFSRIATINRAMAWTYQQMTRRQMDYIVWQWLEETAQHFRDDRTKAENYAKEHSVLPKGTCKHREALLAQGESWNIGYLNPENGDIQDNQICINGNPKKLVYFDPDTETLSYGGETDISGEGGFGNWLRNGRNSNGERIRDSLYSQRNQSFLGGDRRWCGLGLQIDDDLRNIRDMSRVVAELAEALPTHVTAAVSGILDANVPDYMRQGDCQYFISQSANPFGDYFETFDNSPESELTFLSMGDKMYKNEKGEWVYLPLGWGSQTLEGVFGTGIDNWFERDSSRSTGFHRLYDSARMATTLKAEWSWYSTGWTCQCAKDNTDRRTQVAHADLCVHRHVGKCACENNAVVNIQLPTRYPRIPRVVTWEKSVNAICRANNNHAHGYDTRFSGTIDGETVWARPLRLSQAYFGPNGTITVGLARRNENPWFSLLGRVTGGIYSAFSPLANSWSFCFASAKAGYKLYNVPKDFHIMAHLGDKEATHYREDAEERYSGNVRALNGPRDYCIDWKSPERRFADWEFEYDEQGNVVRDEKGRKKIKTRYGLDTAWRQSWNLVQDDWDALMVPVRQGGSASLEIENYSLRDWWEYRLNEYARYDWQKIPYRYEPHWRSRNNRYLAQVLQGADWRVLTGSGVPNTVLSAGPSTGDRGDPLNGRLVGDVWQGWQNGQSAPSSSGTSQWEIGNPGHGINWDQLGSEMYH